MAAHKKRRMIGQYGAACVGQPLFGTADIGDHRIRFESGFGGFNKRGDGADRDTDDYQIGIAYRLGRIVKYRIGNSGGQSGGPGFGTAGIGLNSQWNISVTNGQTNAPAHQPHP